MFGDKSLVHLAVTVALYDSGNGTMNRSKKESFDWYKKRRLFVLPAIRFENSKVLLKFNHCF